MSNKDKKIMPSDQRRPLYGGYAMGAGEFLTKICAMLIIRPDIEIINSRIEMFNLL